MLKPTPNYVSMLCMIGVFVSASLTHAQSMRYALETGQKFSYEVEIVVDGGSAKTTYKGVTNYVVTKADAGQSSLKYTGGLRESKVSKQANNGIGGPFGGFRGGFPGPPSFPSPFSRPTFAGKTQTTNKFTITTRGTTLALDGDSQLPYLLGNVSLLPFEYLPEGDERQWSTDTGIAISKENENSRDRFSPFGRFGPFGDTQQKSTQAAGEVTSYQVQSDANDAVIVKKTYKLTTPKTPGKDTFSMTGDGRWTFDRKDNVPQSCDMKFKLAVQSGNATITVPITLKFNRLTAEKIAEMEAAAKMKAEELKRKAAEAKAEAERPFTAAEKTEVLASLQSGDATRIRKTLSQLAAKSLENPDAEIVAAIQTHLSSNDRATASAASKALAKWSPDYAQQSKLNKDYQGPGPVKSTGLVVESITPLYVGQIVQAQRNRRGSFWFAGRIKELMPSGEVKVAFLTWGKERERDTESVARRQIQLPPPEFVQPVPRPTTTANPAEPRMPNKAGPSKTRTWSDASGKFSVEAEFVDVADGKVNLKRSDGRTMSIQIDKLSKKDQEHIIELEKEAENPFILN